MAKKGKKKEYCLRCGMDKKELRKKGYYISCSGWGIFYGRHLFNPSKNYTKVRSSKGMPK